MWIKIIDDSFLNTDHVVNIKYDEDSDTTDFTLDSGGIYEVCEGDRTQEIIQKIISGEKYMEVL